MESFKGWIKLVQFTSFNPIFKGAGLVVVGGLALLLAWVWRNKTGKQEGGWFLFVGVASLLVVYGVVILVLRPDWWISPTQKLGS